jgi:hypothetical protein
MNKRPGTTPPTIVPFAATPAGETPGIAQWAHRAVWTERMLETLLDNKVRGGKWHTLMDKVFDVFSRTPKPQHEMTFDLNPELLDTVWGSDVYVEARTVDVHVGRLRKALNESGEKDPIRTVRSAGYSFDETFAE